VNSSLSAKSDLGKIASGTAIAFGGALLGNGLAYLYGLIIGRALGAESVGLYFLGLVIMQLTNAVCRVGLPEGLLRFVAIHNGEGDLSRVKGHILAAMLVVTMTSIIGASLLFLSANLLSVSVFKQPELASYLRWFAVALPFFSIFTLALNAIQAFSRMALVVLNRDLVQPIIMVILAFVLFSIIPGSMSFLAAFVGSLIVALGCSGFFLVRVSSLLDHSSPTIFEWRMLLAFSLPVAGSDLTHYLSRWSDTIMLSFFRQPAEVGIYNAAVRTTLLLSLIAVSINALYAPIIANHYKHNRYQQVQAILRILVRWSLTLALPLVLATSLLSSDILSLWGPEFVIGAHVLTFLAVAQMIFIISNLLAFTLLMCGRQYVEVGNSALMALLSVVTTLILIPIDGIRGAAVSMLIVQAVVLVIRTIEVRYILGLKLYTKKYIKPIVALILFLILVVPLHKLLGELITIVCFGSQPLLIAVMFSLFVTLYFLALYLLGLETEDLAVWRELQTRPAGATAEK
jgi:O-antigen/teichoic acid export membrane protein